MTDSATERLLKSASKLCGIPAYLLRFFATSKLIHMPPTTSEIIGLHFLKCAYRRDEVLKWALAKMSLKRRMRLIRTAGMNRLESWIFARYLNSAGKKLSVKRVATEAAKSFGVPTNGALYKTVHRIRRKAYRERAKQKTPPKAKPCR